MGVVIGTRSQQQQQYEVDDGRDDVAGVAVAAPGGYTGYGGVYKNMNQGADYMNHAKSAAKMAINLFEDESLNFDEEIRPARKAVYVPTFFTSVPQQPQASNQGARFSRNTNTNNGQTYDLPIFYNEYRPKTLHIA